MRHDRSGKSEPVNINGTGRTIQQGGHEGFCLMANRSSISIPIVPKQRPIQLENRFRIQIIAKLSV